MQETQVLFLSQEDNLKKEMATNSSVLAWRIPWTDKLPSMEFKESDMTEQLTHSYTRLLSSIVLIK